MQNIYDDGNNASDGFNDSFDDFNCAFDDISNTFECSGVNHGGRETERDCPFQSFYWGYVQQQ